MSVVRELTVYEIEEYTVSQEVPFVVEKVVEVVDVQQEVFTVPVKDVIEHEHAVLHDVNFGVEPEYPDYQLDPYAGYHW